ncbi:MAG: FAD-dependent oxidoreductase [Pseudomonadota bacterium]
MKVWKCDVCGYIHKGDNPPETCPICGVGAEMFSLVEAISSGVAKKEEAPVVLEGVKIGRVVIVGAGIAGLSAAEQIKDVAPSVGVTIVSNEPSLPYYRLNLTRFLAGEVDEKSLVMHQASWFSEQGIELVEGEAAELDRAALQISLKNGKTLPYDRLVLANGSHAFVPPITGATRDGVFVVRTLSDVHSIMQRIKPDLRCICVGGGLLGLEVASALAKRGVQTKILEGYGWLLPRQLPEKPGRMLQEHLEKKGMKVLSKVRAKEIVGDEGVRGIRLESGEEIPADVVIFATGVRPNSYLARQSHLAVNSGVLVDDRMATSDPAIFAAGDVAEHQGVVYGIWPAAYAQGVVAGTNAAGGNAAFHGLPPSNRLKVSDVDLFSIGKIDAPDASYQIVEEEGKNTYSRFVLHDGRMVGTVLYGDTSLATPVSEAIETGTQIPEMPEVLRSKL